MEDNWESRQSYEPKPQKHNIALALLVGATTFSYLGCYALVGALQKYEVIEPFPDGHDPRWRWFLYSFTGLLAVGFGIFGLVRLMGHPKLDADELVVEEETPVKRAAPAQSEAAKLRP